MLTASLTGYSARLKQRHDACLTNVARPPVKVDDFSDLRKAVNETQRRMGIEQPDGNAFRLHGGKKQRQTTSGGDGSQ